MSSTLFLDKNAKNQIGNILSKLLADTFVLYVKTLNFHWNVTDYRFLELHELFQKLYEELAESIDVIAERIRALNVKAPGSMKEFSDLSQLEESHSPLNGTQMIHQLLNDHHFIIEKLRQNIDQTAKFGDDGSADLLIQRLRAHEKTAWILQSHLPKETEETLY